jgi:cobalt/nickel transport system ATP-binding protein
MEHTTVVEIENLSFGYSHDRKIFDGLNFKLMKGQKVGLIGSNGSGKTTLFHLIMGLLKPASGDIKVFGKSRKEEKDFDEVRQRIGLLFQDSDDQLFCPTVEEDIAFGPLNLGKTQMEAWAVVKETCEMLGLKGYEKNVTYRLSGGEKRLVALATVIAMKPDCYLLDEPTSGLDERAEAVFLEYLKKYAGTYIVITHDTDFLKKATNITYLIKDEKIVMV